MAKIIVVYLNSESVIATFKRQNEAFQCASLLKSLCNDERATYYVEFREKGRTVRRQPENISRLIQFMNENERNRIASLFPLIANQVA